MKRAISTIVLLGVTFLAGAGIGHRLTTGTWPSVGEAANRLVSRIRGQPAKSKEIVTPGDATTAPAFVQAIGRVEPEDGVYSIGAPPGVRIDEVLVRQGDAVEAGQPLFQIEGGPERLAQKESITAQLAEADALIKLEGEEESLQKQDAKIEKKDLQNLADAERKTQEETLKLLEEKAKSSLEDYQRLYQLNQDKRQIISTQELELKYYAMRNDAVSLQNARTNLEALKKSQDSRLSKADLLPRKVEIATQRAKLAAHRQSLEKELALADLRLKLTRVVSPIAGRVLAVVAQSGQTAATGPVIELGKTRRMFVVAEVYEDQIQYVKAGQSAEIKAPALKHPYKGKVESTALMVSKADVLGLDPAAAAYSRVVEVKVEVTNPDESLRDQTHLQVDVTIDTAENQSTDGHG